MFFCLHIYYWTLAPVRYDLRVMCQSKLHTGTNRSLRVELVDPVRELGQIGCLSVCTSITGPWRRCVTICVSCARANCTREQIDHYVSSLWTLFESWVRSDVCLSAHLLLDPGAGALRFACHVPEQTAHGNK